MSMMRFITVPFTECVGDEAFWGGDGRFRQKLCINGGAMKVLTNATTSHLACLSNFSELVCGALCATARAIHVGYSCAIPDCESDKACQSCFLAQPRFLTGAQ
jgi:hypothetical protein